MAGGGGDEKLTVSFVDGDSELSNVDIDKNSYVTEPAAPTKEGYIFAGWYSDSACTKEFDFKNTKITENTKIYAKFVANDEKFTVSFNTNGGSSIASQTINAGEKVTKPADPTKANNKFAGWYCDSALTQPYDFSSQVLSSFTLYAKWTAESGTYTVTFNSNGGSAVPAQTVKAGEKAVKPANPTKSGYSFSGWYSDASLTTQYDFNSAVNADITLCAKWTSNGGGGGGGPVTPTTYTVTFCNNNETYATVSGITSGTSLGDKMPAIPSNPGYAFLGWADDSGNAFTETNIVNGNKTVSAQWSIEIVKSDTTTDPNNPVAKVEIADDDAAKKLVNDAKAETILIDADISDDTTLPIQISKEDLSKLNTAMADSTVNSLEFKTKDGSVTLDSATISALVTGTSEGSNDNIIIKVENVSNDSTANAAKIGDNPLIDVSITNGTKEIDLPEGSKITVKINAEDLGITDLNNCKIFYVTDAGIIEESFKHTVFGNIITFETSHNSYYAIVEPDGLLESTITTANNWLKEANLNELFEFKQDTIDLTNVSLIINADKVFGDSNALQTVKPEAFNGFLTNFGKFVNAVYGNTEVAVKVNDIRGNITNTNTLYANNNINADGVKGFILDFGYGLFELIGNMTSDGSDHYKFKDIDVTIGESDPFNLSIVFTGSGMDKIQSFAKTIADHISMNNISDKVTITLTAPDALMNSVYNKVSQPGNNSSPDETKILVWVLFNCYLNLEGVLDNIADLNVSDVFGSENDAVERLISIFYSNSSLINKVIDEIISIEYYCPDALNETLSEYISKYDLSEFSDTCAGTCEGHDLLINPANFTMGSNGWNSFIVAISSMFSQEALATNPGNFYIGDGKYQIDVKVTLGLEELGLGNVPVEFTLILDIFDENIDELVANYVPQS